MNWWQSLLIATIPAILTGIVSFLVANQQVKVAKKELEEKYIKENELYVSKTRFDKEFSIYQELLEKFVSMVIDCGNLFPVGLVRIPTNENELLKFNRAIYEKIEKSYFVVTDCFKKIRDFDIIKNNTIKIIYLIISNTSTGTKSISIVDNSFLNIQINKIVKIIEINLTISFLNPSTIDVINKIIKQINERISRLINGIFMHLILPHPLL